MSDVQVGQRDNNHGHPDTWFCQWRSNWEDDYLRCDDPAIPGGRECATHLIVRVHREDSARLQPNTNRETA